MLMVKDTTTPLFCVMKERDIRIFDATTTTAAIGLFRLTLKDSVNDNQN